MSDARPPEGAGPDPGAPLPDAVAGGSDGEADIDAYLRQHAGRYTHQALDAQLRAAGHSDEAIAAAWQRVQGATWSGPQPLPPAGFAGFLYLLAGIAIIVVYGGSALLGGLGALVFSTSETPLGSVVLGLYAVGVLAAAVATLRYLRGVERRRRGIGPMLVGIAVVTLVYAGISGACFAGLAAVNSL